MISSRGNQSKIWLSIKQAVSTTMQKIRILKLQVWLVLHRELLTFCNRPMITYHLMILTIAKKSRECLIRDNRHQHFKHLFWIKNKFLIRNGKLWVMQMYEVKIVRQECHSLRSQQRLIRPHSWVLQLVNLHHLNS